MASILLDPGESFEHLHEHASFTTLVSGQVRFSDGLKSQIMRVGEPIYVAPGCSHTIVNVGDVSANVACVHQPQGVRP